VVRLIGELALQSIRASYADQGGVAYAPEML
jgi:hypothetical protein